MAAANRDPVVHVGDRLPERARADRAADPDTYVIPGHVTAALFACTYCGAVFYTRAHAHAHADCHAKPDADPDVRSGGADTRSRRLDVSPVLEPDALAYCPSCKYTHIGAKCYCPCHGLPVRPLGPEPAVLPVPAEKPDARWCHIPIKHAHHEADCDESTCWYCDGSPYTGE